MPLYPECVRSIYETGRAVGELSYSYSQRHYVKSREALRELFRWVGETERTCGVDLSPLASVLESLAAKVGRRAASIEDEVVEFETRYLEEVEKPLRLLEFARYWIKEFERKISEIATI